MEPNSIEQDDGGFVCSICENGNSGQVCETCQGRIPAFKRWLVQSETLPEAQTRFILVHKTKRDSINPLPRTALWYPSKEDALKWFSEMGSDAERYEIREVRVVFP